jgi:hypothetical protein
MGDRANVAIVFDKGQKVYFYTHNYGNELPALVHKAIARRQRWDDPAYLARIIFCEMLQDDDIRQQETGFGISLSPANDRQYPVIMVDTINQTIETEDSDPIGFEDFARVLNPSWKTFKEA